MCVTKVFDPFILTKQWIKVEGNLRLWKSGESEKKCKWNTNFIYCKILINFCYSVNWRNQATRLPHVIKMINNCSFRVEKILCKKCAEMRWFFKKFSAKTLHKNALKRAEMRWNFARNALKTAEFSKNSSENQTLLSGAAAFTQSTAHRFLNCFLFNLILN